MFNTSSFSPTWGIIRLAREKLMCICVDCRWVERCQAYHAVEKQHGAKHLSQKPDFLPQSPRIHISVFDLPESEVGVEWDVRSCESFHPAPGIWQRLRPGEAVPSWDQSIPSSLLINAFSKAYPCLQSLKFLLISKNLHPCTEFSIRQLP